MNKMVCSAAAIFLVLAGMQAAAGENLSAEVLACSAQPDDGAQLACYNRIAARLKAGAPAAPSAAAKPVPDAANARSDFGGDSIPFQPHADRAPDQITARVAKASFNFFHRFTVVLDNGQVWRQDDSDTAIARFDAAKRPAVTIKAGFLGSFHMTIQGVWGSFSVKRIK